MLDRLIALFDGSDIQKIDDNIVVYHRFPDEDEDATYTLSVEYSEDYWVYFNKEGIEKAIEVSPGKFDIINEEDETYILEFFKTTPYSG